MGVHCKGDSDDTTRQLGSGEAGLKPGTYTSRRKAAVIKVDRGGA